MVGDYLSQLSQKSVFKYTFIFHKRKFLDNRLLHALNNILFYRIPSLTAKKKKEIDAGKPSSCRTQKKRNFLETSLCEIINIHTLR